MMRTGSERLQPRGAHGPTFRRIAIETIKKSLTVTRYRTPPAIVTIVGTGNDRQGITFHTNTKNTPSGQPEEGYTWHMKKTFSDKVRDIVQKIPKGKTMT